VQAYDPDGDTLSYSLLGGSPGAINSSTGLFTWTVPTGVMTATVSIQVADGKGGTATQTYTLLPGPTNICLPSRNVCRFSGLIL